MIAAITFLLLPVVALAAAIVCTVFVLIKYLKTAWRVCRPSAAVAGDARSGAAQAPGSPDPAYLSYLARQLRLDVRDTIRTAWRDINARATETAQAVFDKLIEDRNDSQLTPVLFGLALGALLAAPLAAAGLVIAMAIFACTLAVAGAVITVLALALGTAERFLILLRGIQVSCPHDGGCRRFGLPVYGCPAEECDERHSRLSPNRYGVFRHACLCGARLPTATVLGRYRLVAYCPHCKRPLPGRIGAVPIEHIALIGESAFGKSTLMHMLLGSLRDRTVAAHGGFEFASHWDEERLARGLTRLRNGDSLPPTVNRLPDAVMVDVRPTADPGRILYLFDPSGEVYNGQNELQSQQYLRKAESLLILIDPFAIPEVRSRLSQAELERITKKDPSTAVENRRDPAKIIENLAATVLQGPGPRRPRRIALVITKTDALRTTTVGDTLGESPGELRAWLVSIGMKHTLQVLDGVPAEVEFFCSGLGGISGLGKGEPRQDEILDWCSVPESATVMRLSPILSRLVGSNARKPWPATGTGREIPLSYQVWRLVFFGGQVAAVAAVPMLVYAFIG